MYHILHVFWASSTHRVTNFQAFCSSKLPAFLTSLGSGCLGDWRCTQSRWVSNTVVGPEAGAQIRTEVQLGST